MYEYEIEITRVIDGDTVDANLLLGFDVILYKKRIRLYGIDTEESRTRDKVEKVFGKLAKKYLEEQAPVGSRVRLKSHDKGKFGRILGSLYNDDSSVSINDKMCMEHFAVPYQGQSKEEIKAEHLANRKRLIAAGKAPPTEIEEYGIKIPLKN